MKDAFNFIRANFEVKDQKVILRTASTQGSGVFHIEDSDPRTFAEIGMTANTSLIIALEEKELGAPQPTAAVLPPKAHESPSSVVVIDLENDSPRSEQVLKLPPYTKEAKKATGANSEDIILMGNHRTVTSSSSKNSVGSVDIPISGHSLRRQRRKQHDNGVNRRKHSGDVIDLT